MAYAEGGPELPLEAKLDAAVGYLLTTSYDRLDPSERSLRNHILARNGAADYRAGEELVSTLEGVAYVAREQGEREAARFSAGIRSPVAELLLVMERDVDELYRAAPDAEKASLAESSFGELYGRVMQEPASRLRSLVESSAPYSEIMAAAREYEAARPTTLSPAAEAVSDFSIQVDRDRRGISRQAFLIPYGAVSLAAAAASGDIAGGIERMANVGVLSYGREGVRRGLEGSRKVLPCLAKLDDAVDRYVLEPINRHYGTEYSCSAFEKGGAWALDALDTANEKMAQYTGFDLASAAIFGGEIAIGMMSPYSLIPLAVLSNAPRVGMYLYNRFRSKDDGSHLVDEVDREQGGLSKGWNRFKRVLNLGFSVGDSYVNPLALKAGRKVTREDLDGEVVPAVLAELGGARYSPEVLKGVEGYLGERLALGERAKERIRGVTDANLGCTVRTKVGERDMATGRYNWVPEYALDVATRLKVPYEERRGNRAEYVRDADGNVVEVDVVRPAAPGGEGGEQREVVYKRTEGGIEGTIVPILDRHARTGGLVTFPVFGDGRLARYDMFEYDVGLTDLTDKAGAERILYHEARHLAQDLAYWEGIRKVGERVLGERIEAERRAREAAAQAGAPTAEAAPEAPAAPEKAEAGAA